jgi:predicted GTPase
MELLRKGLRAAAGADTTLQYFCRPIQRALAVQRSTSTDDKSLATILIVGRPNVGKSTLFNRLTGRRSALVHDTPSSHVTRDYKEGLARLSDLKFRMIDTSGLEPAMSPESVQGRATRITQQVCAYSTNIT